MLFDFHTTRGSHYIALLIIVDEYHTKLKILDDIVYDMTSIDENRGGECAFAPIAWF